MFNKIENNLINFIVCVIISIFSAILFAIIYRRINENKRQQLRFSISLTIIPIAVTFLVLLSGIIASDITLEGTNTFRGLIVLISGLLILRFRSKNMEPLDLTCLFFIIIYSVILGLGYITVSLILYVIIIVIMILFNKYYSKKNDKNYLLKITVPEDMSFDRLFDDVFEKYTNSFNLIKVKLTDMGTTYNLAYHIEMKDDNVNELLNEIRILNGNMSIAIIKNYYAEID